MHSPLYGDMPVAANAAIVYWPNGFSVGSQSVVDQDIDGANGVEFLHAVDPTLYRQRSDNCLPRN